MTALSACMLPRSTTVYPDALLRGIYGTTRTIAMVGASPNWNRPSYFVMRYLQRKGFRVIPVNPRALDEPILGETVYPDLESIPVPVDGRRRLSAAGGGPRDRTVGGEDRGEGAVAPARHPQPRGRDTRRHRRSDLRRGSLHEDRVRPAQRASWPGAGSTRGSSRAAAVGRSGDGRRRAGRPASRRSRSTRRTASRPGPCTPARTRIRSRAHGTCRSTRRRHTSSRMSITRPPCSTCRPSATSTRA